MRGWKFGEKRQLSCEKNINVLAAYSKAAQLELLGADNVSMGRRLLRHLTYRARALRRQSTPAERKLWELVRGRQLGVKFRRQQPIGVFIVDFCSIEARLVVELDGPYHDQSLQRCNDSKRDALLQADGWTVLRFLNEEVLLTPDKVLRHIRSTLAQLDELLL